ncbi:MAG: Uma2 family endonuclease [Saprospiraceae bacterium]|nr:Uma2 family endonuclease [Saprospiraceae bacterium]
MGSLVVMVKKQMKYKKFIFVKKLLLDMAYPTKILPHYTFDDWKLWEGNWELHEGHPIAMSPHAVPRHQEVAASLMAEFHTALKACKTCTVYDTLDYKISEGSGSGCTDSMSDN